MISKLVAAALAAGVGLALCMTAAPADAAPKRKTYARSATGYSYASGPRTRIYVSRRSWLDAGTQVRPGERKFTDYALPPSDFSRYPLDSRGGFSQQPLPGPFYFQ